MTTTRILVRGGRLPYFLSHQKVTEEMLWKPARKDGTILGYFGRNIGNALFCEGAIKMLATPDQEISVDHYKLQLTSSPEFVDYVNNNYDYYVCPFSTIIREDAKGSLKKMISLINNFKIPFIFYSGAIHLLKGQKFSDFSYELLLLAKQFFYAIADRSAKIGVRGEYSADFLKFIGLSDEQIEVIGCPSFFYNGSNFSMPNIKATYSNKSKVAMNFGYDNQCPPINDLLVKFHSQNPQDFRIVGQVTPELEAINSGKAKDIFLHKTYPDQMAQKYQIPFIDDNFIKQNKYLFPISSEDWIEYLQKFDYCIGSRFHGTVAGVLAQTPTLFLTWDLRSIELSKFHHLPNLSIEEANKLSPEELTSQIDYTEFNQHFSKTFNIQKEFLKANGLQSID